MPNTHYLICLLCGHQIDHLDGLYSPSTVFYRLSPTGQLTKLTQHHDDPSQPMIMDFHCPECHGRVMTGEANEVLARLLDED